MTARFGGTMVRNRRKIPTISGIWRELREFKKYARIARPTIVTQTTVRANVFAHGF
jgi:hypothetical protein